MRFSITTIFSMHLTFDLLLFSNKLKTSLNYRLHVIAHTLKQCLAHLDPIVCCDGVDSY